MNTMKLILFVFSVALGTAHAAGEYEKAVKANNDFGFRFYQAIRKQDGNRVQNRFVSPVSGFLALSMLSNGAQGETERAVRQTIEASKLTREELNRANRDLINQLRSQASLENPVILEIANSLWSDHSLQFRNEFSDLLKKEYDAEARNLDFKSPQAAKTINQWTSDKTHGKISEIVKTPLESQFYLLNATYFKGPWRHPFNEKLTTKENFQLETGTRQVDMMHGGVTAGYVKGTGYEALDMGIGPFHDASVIFILPEKNVAELENRLDMGLWNEVQDRLAQHHAIHDVKVALPKFKFEYEANLIQPLMDLGMGIAFGPGANFEDMIPGSVTINKALQKTYLGMNEIGTEAAAVTVIGGVTSVPNYPKAKMTLNRPFVVVIRDNKTHSVLFLGTVANP